MKKRSKFHVSRSSGTRLLATHVTEEFHHQLRLDAQREGWSVGDWLMLCCISKNPALIEFLPPAARESARLEQYR